MHTVFSAETYAANVMYSNETSLNEIKTMTSQKRQFYCRHESITIATLRVLQTISVLMQRPNPKVNQGNGNINIVHCGYTSILRELSRVAPSPSSATCVSDKIHARSSLRSSPASFQSESRLYYCSAVPRLLASLVGSRESIRLCLIRSKSETIKLRKIFTETQLANFLILLFQPYLSEHSWQSFSSICLAFSGIKI